MIKFLARKKKILFLDEWGAGFNLRTNYSYALKGKRAFAKTIIHRTKRLSTIGVISEDGLLTSMIYPGTLNSAVFLAFTKAFLMDCLDENTVLIMDNASSHKNKETIAIIESTGAKVLFLPPYSPELNPIENCWSVVKNYMKKLQMTCFEDLYPAWKEGLKLITPKICKNCFQHLLKINIFSYA